jgi:hypothetical protein
MALAPRALRSFFPHLPDEVLERIFEFGFHLWLREPWSFLCRSPSEPVVRIETEGPFDVEAEGEVLELLLAEAGHDGRIRGFKLASGRQLTTAVPLAWHTVSVVSPRAVAADAVVDRARGLTWRPDGWRLYMCDMLRGLRDIDHAARPEVSPYLARSLRGENMTILHRCFGKYRPETPEQWLFEGPWAKFYYRVSDSPSEVSFSSVDEYDWAEADRRDREALLESDSSDSDAAAV